VTGVVKQINRSRGGLPKLPVEGVVRLTTGGIEGDWQSNRKHHGGPDKAILMIAAEAVEELAAQGYPVASGSLGENLTVSGMDRHNWRTGQRYRVGDGCVIELTTPRVPCLNLDSYGAGIKTELCDAACRAKDVTSPRWANGGFYARVISEGFVFAGASIELTEELA
jgi:MOSC domain-containing protein YiiM